MIAGVLASLAELELELGRERRTATREARRARGQHIGRPKALDTEKAELARRMHTSGEPASVIATTLGVSRATVTGCSLVQMMKSDRRSSACSVTVGSMDSDCRQLLVAIEEALGVPGQKELPEEPRGYADSLALCLIDSIQSLRSDYAKVVVPVLNRYRAYRAQHGGEAATDGLRQFPGAFDEMGGVGQWTATVGTSHKAPGTAVLKGEAMRQAAEALLAIGVDTTADLRKTAEDPDALEAAHRAWIGVHGLGKASWDYLLMLAGPDGTKADTLLLRFTTRALGLPKTVASNRAQAALKCAADTLGVTQKRLDHAIWLYESEASRKARRRTA